jgi:tetratricopeptide (TPR) repeat protein
MTRILILITLVLTIAACGENQKAAPEAVSDTPESRSSEDSVRVMIESLSQQIIMYPKNPALYIERSYLYYTSGVSEKAILDIETAISLNAKDPEAYYLRGFYALVANQDTLAETYLTKAVELGSENPETYASLGSLNTFRKQYTEARKWYQVAMEKDSLDAAYPYATGMAYYQQRNYKDALKWFEKALLLDPYHSKTLIQLYAHYTEVDKQKSKAKQYNDKLLESDSLHSVARFHIAAALQEEAFIAGRKSGGKAAFDSFMVQAIDEYTKATIRNPVYVQAIYNRAYAYFAMALYDEAMRDFERVLVIDKFHSRSYFMMASIYEYRGELENAKKYFEIALQLNPEFKEAEVAIGEISKRLGK